MIALGLLLLVIAAVVGLVGIFTNLGSSHQLGRTVDLLGYHLHGSTGKLLLAGVIIGAVGMLGLNMLLAGVGRGFKRSISQRKERRSEQRQTKSVVQDRDHLAAELEREHAARVQAEKQRATAADGGFSPADSAHEGMARDGATPQPSVREPGAIPRRDV
jgi:hypothetical protein